MPKTTTITTSRETISPNYNGLVQFLIEPLLEYPEDLSIYCEYSNQNKRVWIRVAFDGSDRGRVYGRGGRNIQAIRIVLETAAAAADQSLYLDIYENNEERKPKVRVKPTPRKLVQRKHRVRRSGIPKPLAKPRLL